MFYPTDEFPELPRSIREYNEDTYDSLSLAELIELRNRMRKHRNEAFFGPTHPSWDWQMSNVGREIDRRPLPERADAAGREWRNAWSKQFKVDKPFRTIFFGDVNPVRHTDEPGPIKSSLTDPLNDWYFLELKQMK